MPTVLAPLLLVTLLAVGCSSGESGSPTAQDPAQDPPSETERETTSATGVDRPAPIDLTTVDVCQVVSAMPLADFGLDADRPPLAGESDLFPGAKDCFANGTTNNVSLLIVAVTDQDARSYVETANAGKSEADAAGYPLTVLTPANPNSCLGVVDVHDEQLLYVSYGLSSPLEQPVTPQPELCRAVPGIATAAIGALD
ncbi:DUF3558 domain-containing protein [Actinophytocola gossypii]|uniref:DUF3558 domain-containing protein n=1 Tax=Actinophytocola gossypii TaxID=2812003 RepID=A0ABT2JDK3_9PSEU|nr:DUF3558 domain-containing protein [Actinophytocola gossypii]MCT2585967.1 DUF3558 domain-containing protein [Actinophytocola gossypii]